MKTLFCLLVLFGLALASKELQFAQWMTKFNKEYSSDTEMAYRFGIFSAKLDAIEQWNNEGHSWKKGINQFSDLTTEEFAEQYLMTPYTVEGATADSGTDISSNVDWVSAGAVTAVKNQHQCGKTTFSIQYLKKNFRKLLGFWNCRVYFYNSDMICS